MTDLEVLIMALIGVKGVEPVRIRDGVSFFLEVYLDRVQSNNDQFRTAFVASDHVSLFTLRIYKNVFAAVRAIRCWHYLDLPLSAKFVIASEPNRICLI